MSKVEVIELLRSFNLVSSLSDANPKPFVSDKIKSRLDQTKPPLRPNITIKNES